MTKDEQKEKLIETFDQWFSTRFAGIRFPIERHQALLMARAAYARGIQVHADAVRRDATNG